MNSFLQKIFSFLPDNSSKKITAKNVRDSFAEIDKRIDEVDLGITGDAELTTQPSLTKFERWSATIPGTYSNFKEIINGVLTPITISPQELKEFDIILSVNNGVAKKVYSEKSKIKVEDKFDINSVEAISNGRTTTLAKVLDSFLQPKAVRTIDFVFNNKGLVTNVTGAIVVNSAYYYQKIILNPGEKGIFLKAVRPVTASGSNNQKLYPSVLSENASGVFTGLLDSVPSTDPNPYVPFEGFITALDDAINIWVVIQGGFGWPIIRTIEDYKNVEENSVKKYIDNKLSFIPVSNEISVPLSKYSGVNDPTLQNGTIDKDGFFINSPIDRCGFIDIPVGAQYITSVNLDSPTYFQFATNVPVRISGSASTVLPIKIPTGATRLYLNILTKNTNLLNTATNTITFDTNSIHSVITTESLQGKIIQTSDFGNIMLGEKIYTIAGIEKRLYTESLFAGFYPRINYNIEPYGDDVMFSGGDKGRFIILNNPGNFTIRVYNTNRNMIAEKNAFIYTKAMPSSITKLLSGGNMQVMFIGDSLWHNNQNGIGKEWLRMLNTNNAQTVIDHVVYKKAFNLGSGRIELVGKQGDATNMWTVANSLENMMEGIVPYNNGVQGNPFFKPDSGKPNELDDDGFNKQIDIAWFIQSVCGTGKYPKYIYLACGVNDIYYGGWRKDSLPFIKERLKRVLYRIKKACDAIAGGNSDVKILLVNHQFYPLNSGHTFEDTFSSSRQRKLWADHYTNCEAMIKNESYKGLALSSFVRFVDCASSFDVDNGYNYIQYPRNNRSTVVENTIDDTVHVGTEGTLLYADALLDDFLYHECQ